MTSLKQKSINGVLWSFFDQFANLGITFIVGVFLARILSPKEYGLIGMVTVFIAVSTVFINSGFANALIRKKDCTEDDYSTVFIFNFITSLIFYFILFITAPFISTFFHEIQLIAILRVLAIVLIIDSLSIIQSTILVKRVDFKLQARISIVSSALGGILGLVLALNDFGVWALVFMQLSSRAINTMLLWCWNKWKPNWNFSKSSFNELFGFGSKLLISGLIDTLFRNINLLVIGKYFNAIQLGYYTRAEQYNMVPAQSITGIVSRVTYPVLAQMQDDEAKLKQNYKQIVKSVMFVSFNIMLGVAATAEAMIHALIGHKWEQTIIYLQLLSFVGMMYPLHALNLNILQVKGKSDLFLRLEIIKKVMAIPILFIAIFYGIKSMIIGTCISSLIAYYLNSYWSGKLIKYPIREQLTDLIPSLMFAVFMAVVVYFSASIFTASVWITLFFQLLVGVIVVVLTGELFKNESYIFLKDILLSQLNKLTKNG